jgi:hypothetical protein
MTSTNTTKTTTRRPLPWGRYRDEVDAQIEAGLAREQARGPRTRTVNGVPTYRDGGSRESYTVGYGGERNYQTPARQGGPKPISEPQKKLLRDLATERDLTQLVPGLDGTSIDTYTTREASALIKRMLALPRLNAAPVVEAAPEPTPAPAAPARARLDFKAIPDGNYAVREDGVVKFYRVSTGRNGYKNVQVRASDELHMLFSRAGIAVLHRIVEAGLAESRMLFVTELGRCCRCGRSLTNKASREDALVNGGFGPECVGK